MYIGPESFEKRKTFQLYRYVKIQNGNIKMVTLGNK